MLELFGGLINGVILSLLALAVFISFRVFEFTDVTVDGSFTMGASITAVMIVAGAHPLLGMLVGCVAGAAAGATTAFIHTRFGVHRLLSGILMMTALYSVNLRIMGRSNIPLIAQTTVMSFPEGWGRALFGGATRIELLGWDVPTRDISVLVFVLLISSAAGGLIYLFLRTDVGTAMQAAGDGPQMIRALGVSVENMTVLGLMLANSLAALAGSLFGQYQGFADVQMGIGMVVWGLGSIIIGTALVGTRQIEYLIVGTIMGSVLFRLVVAIALRAGLDPGDLRLITAVFVFIALIAPVLMNRVRVRSLAAARANTTRAATE